MQGSDIAWNKVGKGATLMKTFRRHATHAVESIQRSDEWLLVNTHAIISFVGTALGFACLFYGLLFSSLNPIIEHNRLSFIVSLCITYLLLALFSHQLQSYRLQLAIAAGALGCLVVIEPASNIASGLSLDEGMFYGICSGVGSALATLIWIELLCTTLGKHVRIVIASCMAFAFLIIGMTLSSRDMVGARGALFLLLLSAVCYLAQRIIFPAKNRMAFVSSRESDSRCRIKVNSIALTMSTSMAQGFALYHLSTSIDQEGFAAGTITLTSFAVFCILAVDSARTLRISESVIRYLTLPVIATCTLLLLFMPERTWTGLCIASFSFSLIPCASSTFATCGHIVRDNLSSLRVGGFVGGVSMFGLLAGFVGGWLTFSSTLLQDKALPTGVAFLVVVLIVVTVVFDQKSLYPSEKMMGRAGGEDTAEQAAGHGQWARRCDLVSKKYKLTAREREVMFLLAKGYNAELIQERLYISKNTIRCHTYNIYSKVGIHSKTDLIHLVEATKIKGE